jgi:hypothetical protein
VTDIIAFASTGAGSGEAIVQEWIGRRGNAVTQAMKSISEAASAPLTVSRLVVAAGLISGLLHPHGLSPTSTGEPSRQ